MELQKPDVLCEIWSHKRVNRAQLEKFWRLPINDECLHGKYDKWLGNISCIPAQLECRHFYIYILITFYKASAKEGFLSVTLNSIVSLGFTAVMIKL